MQTTGASDLTVRFLGGPPSEDVVRFAQRCASQAAFMSPVTLVLQWNEDKTAAREVRLECDGRVLLSETDPDLLLAVRNAFARAAIAAPRAQQPS